MPPLSSGGKGGAGRGVFLSCAAGAHFKVFYSFKHFAQSKRFIVKGGVNDMVFQLFQKSTGEKSCFFQAQPASNAQHGERLFSTYVSVGGSTGNFVIVFIVPLR